MTTVTNPSSDKVLLITIASDIQNLVSIYVSTSASPDFRRGSFPTRASASQYCFYSSIDTCALHIPDPSDLPDNQTDLIVAFTVEVSTACTYTLDVSLTTVYPIVINTKYTVKLTDTMSGMMELMGYNFMTDSGGMF
jgi:hypothetical protein